MLDVDGQKEWLNVKKHTSFDWYCCNATAVTGGLFILVRYCGCTGGAVLSTQLTLPVRSLFSFFHRHSSSTIHI